MAIMYRYHVAEIRAKYSQNRMSSMINSIASQIVKNVALYGICKFLALVNANRFPKITNLVKIVFPCFFFDTNFQSTFSVGVCPESILEHKNGNPVIHSRKVFYNNGFIKGWHSAHIESVDYQSGYLGLRTSYIAS